MLIQSKHLSCLNGKSTKFSSCLRLFFRIDMAASLKHRVRVLGVIVEGGGLFRRGSRSCSRRWNLVRVWPRWRRQTL